MKNLTDFKPGDRIRILDVDFVRREFRGLIGTVIEETSDEQIRFELDEELSVSDDTFGLVHSRIFTGTPDSFEHYDEKTNNEISSALSEFIDEF